MERTNASAALRTVTILLLAAGVAGCTGARSDSAGSSAIGAFAGTAGLAGQGGAAALAEALRGGLIAGEIGTALRSEDRRRGLAAEYQALEFAGVGQPVTWSGSNDRVTGEVVAAAPYRVGSQDCRQYTHTVRTADSTTSARGTACREADGGWTLLT